MGLKNTATQYGKLAIILHWGMALFIISIIAVGFFMTSMEDGDTKWAIYRLHKAFGVLILVLALFRWFWVLSNEKVGALDSYSKMEIGLAHAGKWFLMLLMLVMPASGLIMSIAGGRAVDFFGLFKIPAFAEANKSLAGMFHDVHVYAAWGLSIIIGLHLLFALKHHFLDKDATLQRMLGRVE